MQTLPDLNLEHRGEDLIAVCFTSMASPCEVLLPAISRDEALEIGAEAAREAWRVEQKYSRYRDDSVIAWIHANRGRQLEVDPETAALIDFAAHCHEMSGGLFDITSGVLRRAWCFDRSERVPAPGEVSALLAHVGFDKLDWQRPRLLLPPEMELDFGGFGKEYAVDRAYDLVSAYCRHPFLVNFGGDLRANRAPARGSWQVGIERPDRHREAQMLLDLKQGALATSGDSHRFILKDGVRYGHILDPRTGWPVSEAARSITVAASSCTEAGLLSTWALLLGGAAESFLDDQCAPHWVLR